MPQSFSVIAKTLSGLEEALAAELQQLGIAAEPLHRAVRFTGSNAELYRANYCSRLAVRFLKFVATFKVVEQQDLYDQVKAIPWEEFITERQTLPLMP